MRARHPVLKSPHLSQALRLTGHLLVHHSHRASRTGSSAPAATAGKDGSVRARRRRALQSRPCGGARAGDGDGAKRGGQPAPWWGAVSGPTWHWAADCVVRRRGSWWLLECAIRRRQARAAQLNSSGSERVLRVSWKLVEKKRVRSWDVFSLFRFVTVDRVCV
ncbi:hypothetical protein PVAP13_2NG594920 [Panicum virgatum]|uniref:Uncharacterized protein n=1 Tax=Panicum virgatum TaxID=38727 RepID=A0A8T0W4T1_PANVG|nr:hypothetical protein PVAP13_2NG594920 [Panicum virgatum]